MIIHLNIKIHGKVHGVGFRDFALRIANERSIKGFCQNKSDGTVYCEIETTQMKADEFLEWVYRGSIMARVSKIDVEPAELVGFNRFEIKR
jgi:acylphosphatase